MKIKLDIEADAQEMRDFLGLPDVKPLQQEMLENIRENMHKGVAGFDPLTLMKPVLPAQMQSLDALQKAFWNSLGGASGDSDTQTAKENKKT